MRVDFPAGAPRRAWTSPARSSKSTPASTGTPLKAFVMRCMLTTAALMPGTSFRERLDLDPPLCLGGAADGLGDARDLIPVTEVRRRLRFLHDRFQEVVAFDDLRLPIAYAEGGDGPQTLASGMAGPV